MLAPRTSLTLRFPKGFRSHPTLFHDTLIQDLLGSSGIPEGFEDTRLCLDTPIEYMRFWRLDETLHTGGELFLYLYRTA